MDKKNLKAKIEARIRQVREDIEELKELTKPIAPENAIGRVSRMDAINNKAINDNALRKAKSRLNSLEYALGKLDDPEFGRCASCGEEIQEGRILLMPESPYCISCARRR